MNTRLEDSTTTGDPVVRGLVIVTAVITIIGVLVLIRAAVGDGFDHVVVAAYAGQEVHRETVARTTLAAANWTVVIPADATRPLERAGFQ